MENFEKLKSEICRYIDSCTVPSKQGLHKFIDTLPFELFIKKTEGYKIYVQPTKEDRESFIEFLISCGFGSEAGFWSCAKEEGEGYLFDTSSSMLCEFVVKDGLKRRYSIALDDIPLDENNVKRIILSKLSSAQYKVTFTFDAIREDEVVSDSAQSASFEYRNYILKTPLFELLGIKDSDNILNLHLTRGDIASVTGQVVGRSGYYTVSYPLHCTATILVESEDSDDYILLQKAIEVFMSSINNPRIQITKRTLSSIGIVLKDE